MHHEDARSRHDFREFRVARDFETDGALQRLVFYQFRFHSRFSRGRWCEQCTSSRHNRTVLRAQDHGVAGVQATVDQDHIQRRPETLDDFYFQYRTLQIITEHELCS